MKGFAAAALMLLAAPAMAQDAPVESVTVHGSSLAGVWHGGLLGYGFRRSFFSAPKYAGVVEGFCRIAPRKGDLEMYCLQTLGPPATVTIDGTHVHFAWGTMMHGGGFDGDLVTAGYFRGRLQIKRWGITYENPAVSEATRVTPAPDKTGKAALLRRILDEGLVGVPQDTDAMKRNDSFLGLPKLGAIQFISYLGQQTKWDLPSPGSKLDLDHLDLAHIPNRPDFFSVYFVAFVDGECLCGLHQRDDGVLDALQCV